MQELVASRGVVHDIEFNVKNRRYVFDGHCPFGFTDFENNTGSYKVEKLPVTDSLGSFDSEAPF